MASPNTNATSGTATLTVQLGTTKIVADVLKKPAGSAVVYGAKLTRTSDNTALANKQLDFYDTASNTLIGSAMTDATGRATINTTAPAVTPIAYQRVRPFWLSRSVRLPRSANLAIPVYM